MRNSRVMITKKLTPQEILDALNREDYYKILKVKKNPREYLTIKWNSMRTKFTILNRENLL